MFLVFFYKYYIMYAQCSCIYAFMKFKQTFFNLMRNIRVNYFLQSASYSRVISLMFLCVLFQF